MDQWHLNPDDEEGIELESYTKDGTIGVIIAGKLYSLRKLNRAIVKEMIWKSWQLEANVILGDRGLNIYRVHFPYPEKTTKILNPIEHHRLPIQYHNIGQL